MLVSGEEVYNAPNEMIEVLGIIHTAFSVLIDYSCNNTICHHGGYRCFGWLAQKHLSWHLLPSYSARARQLYPAWHMDRYHESALRIAIPEESLLTVVQGLGGGGQAEPYVVNASNTISYGLTLTDSVAYGTLSIWLFWALGTFDVEADSVSLSMGLLRAGESLGSALSYTVGATWDTSLMANLIISVAIFYVSTPFTAWSSHLIQDRLPNECLSDSIIEDIEQWQETEAKQVNLEPSIKR